MTDKHIEKYKSDKLKAKIYLKNKRIVDMLAALSPGEASGNLRQAFAKRKKADKTNKYIGLIIVSISAAAFLSYLTAFDFNENKADIARKAVVTAADIVNIGKGRYNLGLIKITEGKKDEAILCLSNAGNYPGAQEKKAELIVEKQPGLVQLGDEMPGEYGRAFETGRYVTILAYDDHAFALRKNGKVEYFGGEGYGCEYVYEWEDIISLAAHKHTVYGLTKQGKVLALGRDAYPEDYALLNGAVEIRINKAGTLFALTDDGHVTLSTGGSSTFSNENTVSLSQDSADYYIDSKNITGSKDARVFKKGFWQ
jgi:hypothetical protein